MCSDISPYTIRPIEADELQQLVNFIVPLQADPQSRCLHVDWTAEGILADVQDLNQPFTEAFRVLLEGDTWLGILGCDQDLEAGRSWLHGPFIDPAVSDSDWQQLAGALFVDLFDRLPASINRLSNYLELNFERGLTQHADQGFVPKGISHIYRADHQAVHSQAAIRAITPDDHAVLAALHDRAFPQSWLSPAELSSTLDETHQVLVAEHQGQPAGYIRLSQHISLLEGTVDYVAVDSAYRGLGLGRQLLLAGLDWIFNQRNLQTAFLNVSDDNANARKLYESAGFSLYQSGVALDWWRPSKS